MRAGGRLLRTYRRLAGHGIPRWALPVAGAAAVVTCSVAVWSLAFAFNGGGGPPSSGADTVVTMPTATTTPTPLAEVERLIIPAINVDAPVIARTVADNGLMPSPDGPEDVILYDFSALPGLGGSPGGGGNAVFAGHVDYYDYGPAVFSDLHDIKDGDQITVRLRDGTQLEYTARSNRIVDPAATRFNDIVAATPEESLTVITCAGDFDPETQTYDMRRIVWAVRAS